MTPRHVLMLATSALLLLTNWCGATNMDANEKWSWSENAGWINWSAAHTGVTVRAAGYLSGYAWSESIGWIKLGSGTGPYANTTADNWGVNLAPDMRLSGFAWSENAGWINFAPSHGTAAIDDATGRLSGFAWSEGIGWINLQSPLAPENPQWYGARTLANLTPGTVLIVL